MKKIKKFLSAAALSLPSRRSRDGGVNHVSTVEKEMEVRESADRGTLKKQCSGKRSVHYLALQCLGGNFDADFGQALRKQDMVQPWLGHEFRLNDVSSALFPACATAQRNSPLLGVLAFRGGQGLKEEGKAEGAALDFAFHRTRRLGQAHSIQRVGKFRVAHVPARQCDPDGA
ncbi:hypothetical protein G3O01_03510 [Burkholderia sp. Ac-20365]|nr:hypothetical protein [Burkholderia sp. Ac-20365]